MTVKFIEESELRKFEQMRNTEPVSTPGDKPLAFISMCLLGIDCRYHGSIPKDNKTVFTEFSQRYHLIPVCPEQLGGLPTPREPCSVVKTEGKIRVIGRETGTEYTEEYKRGAKNAIGLMVKYGSTHFIGCKYSPSCDSVKGIVGIILQNMIGYTVESI